MRIKPKKETIAKPFLLKIVVFTAESLALLNNITYCQQSKFIAVSPVIFDCFFSSKVYFYCDWSCLVDSNIMLDVSIPSLYISFIEAHKAIGAGFEILKEIKHTWDDWVKENQF